MIAAMFAVSAFAVVFSAAGTGGGDIDRILGEGGDIWDQMNYGGEDGTVVFYDVVPYNSGYIAVGYADANACGLDSAKGGKDAIIVMFDYRFDQDMNVALMPVWSVNFGGAGDDEFFGVALWTNYVNGVTTARVVAVGYSDDNSFYDGSSTYYGNWEGIPGFGDKDAIVVVFDPDTGGIVGNPINFGGEDDDVFHDVVITRDGDVIAVGYSDVDSFYGNTNTGYWLEMGVSGYGGRDAIIVAFEGPVADGIGNAGWPIEAFCFGGEDNDEFFGVDLMYNGETEFTAFAVGYSGGDSFGTGSWDLQDGVNGVAYGNKDAIVVAFGENGPIAAVNFGGSGNDEFKDVAIGQGGDVFTVGYSDSDSFGTGSWADWESWITDVTEGPAAYGNTDAIVVVFGDGGTVLGAANYGGTGADVFNAVAVTPRGIVYAVGSSSENSFGNGAMTDLTAKGSVDAIGVAFSETGIEGAMNYGGDGGDVFYGVALLPEGFVVAVGSSQADTFGTGDWEDFEAFGATDGVIVIIDARIMTPCTCEFCPSCNGCLNWVDGEKCPCRGDYCQCSPCMCGTGHPCDCEKCSVCGGCLFWDGGCPCDAPDCQCFPCTCEFCPICGHLLCSECDGCTEKCADCSGCDPCTCGSGDGDGGGNKWKWGILVLIAVCVVISIFVLAALLRKKNNLV